jgi:hypothetical protein
MAQQTEPVKRAVAVKVVASRVFAHEEPEKEGRARFPFHGKD